MLPLSAIAAALPARRRVALLLAVVGGTALLASCSSAGGGLRTDAPVTDALPAAATEREMDADMQVHHVLSRLTFGAQPGDVERVRAMGVDRWMAVQLAPASIPDAAAERWIAESYRTLAQTPAALMRDYPAPAFLLAQQTVQARLRGEALSGGDMGAMSPDSLRRLTTGGADSTAYANAGRRVALVGQEAASARVARALLSERQLQEVLVDFWSNHFNVYGAKGPLARYHLADYDQRVIRPHALGRFRDLLGAVAASPAMLYYLDNWQSVADSGQPRLAREREAVPSRQQQRGAARRRPNAAQQPQMQRSAMKQTQAAAARTRRRGLNENYGRELLELHTLGVDGGYTQQDVVNVARAFTGWTVNRPRLGGGFVFRPELHDAGAKSVLGQRLPAGRGREDGEAVLDLLAKHPATARFIATKLARRFVSDEPPAALVDRAAARFLATDGDIRQTVWTIITSPEFFARSAYRAKVKSPFETVVSALRATGATADATPRTAGVVALLGQPIYGRQTPDGWPETGNEWLNAGAILGRVNFGLALAAGRVPGARPDGWPGAAGLRTAPRDAQVDGVIAALLGNDASATTRATLMSGTNALADAAARSGTRADDADVVGAGMEGGAVTTGEMQRALPDEMAGGERGRRRAANATRPLPPLTGLAQVVGLALGSPEFQRR